MNNRLHVWVMAVVLCAAGLPQRAGAITMQLQESAAPPQKISTPKVGPAHHGGDQQSEEDRYRGAFEAWVPLKGAFPLKSAKLTLGTLLVLSDENHQRALSRHNEIASFSAEGGRDYWLLKNVEYKASSQRTVKDHIHSDWSGDVTGTLDGVDMGFRRHVTRAGSGPVSTPTVTTDDQRSYFARYNPKDKRLPGLTYETDEKIHRQLAPGQPDSHNELRQHHFGLQWQPMKSSQITATHLISTTIGKTNELDDKLHQTHLAMTTKVHERLDLNVAYDTMRKRTVALSPSGVITGSHWLQEHHTTTRTIGATYKFDGGGKLTYLASKTVHTNVDPSLDEHFAIDEQQWQWDVPLSHQLHLTGQSKATHNAETGTSVQRQADLTINHKSLGLLPGRTTLHFQRQGQFDVDGDDNVDNTFSVTTPLQYMGGDLRVSLRHTLNEKETDSTTQEQDTMSSNQQVESVYKLTPTLTIGRTFQMVHNKAIENAALSSRSRQRTEKDNVTLTIRNPFSDNVGVVKALQYTFSGSNNHQETLQPQQSLTDARVFEHTGQFTLKSSDDFEGHYTLHKKTTPASGTGGDPSRVIQHVLALTAKEVYGFDLSGHYQLQRQNTGSVNTGSLDVSRELAKNLLGQLTYEVTRSVDATGTNPHTLTRYFQASATFTF